MFDKIKTALHSSSSQRVVCKYQGKEYIVEYIVVDFHNYYKWIALATISSSDTYFFVENHDVDNISFI